MATPLFDWQETAIKRGWTPLPDGRWLTPNGMDKWSARMVQLVIEPAAHYDDAVPGVSSVGAA